MINHQNFHFWLRHFPTEPHSVAQDPRAGASFWDFVRGTQRVEPDPGLKARVERLGFIADFSRIFYVWFLMSWFLMSWFLMGCLMGCFMGFHRTSLCSEPWAQFLVVFSWDFFNKEGFNRMQWERTYSKPHKDAELETRKIWRNTIKWDIYGI